MNMICKHENIYHKTSGPKSILKTIIFYSSFSAGIYSLVFGKDRNDLPEYY
jgi:hypothetical protein